MNWLMPLLPQGTYQQGELICEQHLLISDRTFIYFPPLSPLHPTSSAPRAGTFERQEGRGAAGGGWLWGGGLGLECGYWKPRQEHTGKQRARGPAAVLQGKSAGRAALPGKEQALGLVLEH